MVYGNQIGSHYRYDGASRLRSVDTWFQSVPRIYDYTYDNVGNRTSMLLNQAWPYSYSYDDTYRLTDVNYPSGYFTDTTFNYDDAGNRTSVVAGSTTNYSSNNLNQYTAVGGSNFSYDNNGNLTADGSGQTYAYDAENRLTNVSGAASATYAYGPAGRRLTRRHWRCDNDVLLRRHGCDRRVSRRLLCS